MYDEEFLNIPIEKLLYGKVRYVASAPESGEGFIVEEIENPTHGLSDCTVLRGGVSLNQNQLDTISELIMNPESYKSSEPLILRRLPIPVKFTFVIRLHRDEQYLDVLMVVGKIYGWAFFQSKGYYQGALMSKQVGSQINILHNELFPSNN